MEAKRAVHIVRSVRSRAGLSLRALAERAGTSHTTLAAYEAGTKTPRVDTLERIVGAAGQSLEVTLVRRPDGGDRVGRGEELRQALELAAEFPARHEGQLTYPPFPRSA